MAIGSVNVSSSLQSTPDIYGVEVDLENNRVIRLDAAVGLAPGADFDGINPFGGRRRCIVTDDGVVLAYYGEDGYTETGKLTSDILRGITYHAGTAVQVMVEQPQFYYKVVPLKLEKIADGNGYHMRKGRYYVSATPKEGFKLHPLFRYNGVENDKVYLSAYEGSIYDVSASDYLLEDEQIADFTASTGDKLSSIANAKPASGAPQELTRANARILAHNRGTGWEQQTIQAVSASQLLMLIEYASFDMQTAIGKGNVHTPSLSQVEITGVTSNLGNTTGAVISSNNCNIVTYRGEENLWGNIWKFVDGMNVYAYSVHKLYVADHGFADNTITSPYADTGITLAKSNGFIAAFGYNQNFDWLFVASEVSLNMDDLGVQYYQQNSSSMIAVPALGASWRYIGANPFCWNMGYYSSAQFQDVGARAVYFPNVA